MSFVSHLRAWLGSLGHEASGMTADPSEAGVPFERGVAATFRAGSLQTRLTSLAAFALGVIVMTTFLIWYYQHALAQDGRAAREEPMQEARVDPSMALPPLGRIDPPLLERMLGPAPSLPEETFSEPSMSWRETRKLESTASFAPERGERADRRLAGEAFVSATRLGQASGGEARGRTAASFDASDAFDGEAPAGATPGSERPGGPSELTERLEPTVLAAARAQRLPTRQLLLPKGAHLDCTLETAINSALPGMTTCVTATDTFGADGSVVLLERGSKLIGETRGQVRAGSNRVFVLWTEARTPSGVVVPLASPGTDALGRAGLPGEVDRHFWDRFGAAILISVIDGAVQAGVQRQNDGDAVIVNPAGSRDVMTEVLKSTLHIPPTVTKRHGDRISVLVARDLDFRSVYELRAATDR
ncbi:type IV secretion system protein VirB10 [Steroidobacter sp. S1-65]|uniref:Type IV secretion system protein VirB10 n=1 Tax=Steroidobacter gossypii TaxID=2805490 RepID=A0ABS1WXS8_9GAMM|nr:type IV secretion system protein VirB10 [Steroidobacter gossypii]MBM0105789.1 type IV secretion system protein VirB10 [Steroidobacter gossypii]